ncbi:hypothetical protein niasHS_009186 [Heterodera schachtii]|uniref:Uncharacterized protein n=1 Tax=Heterodera schachtii TaxID=97005 RepID=A0ABD2J4X5_HETSC
MAPTFFVPTLVWMRLTTVIVREHFTVFASKPAEIGKKKHMQKAQVQVVEVTAEPRTPLIIKIEPMDIANAGTKMTTLNNLSQLLIGGTIMIFAPFAHHVVLLVN